jgi:single-strand selective monofunctional uracil DNA glycosylase
MTGTPIDKLNGIMDDLIEDLRHLRFGPPVAYVYNPLEYARETYQVYLRRHASPPKEAVFFGMNPGPWGMVQTGIPFGEVNAVKDWLRIKAPVGSPHKTHPKRPVQGFACGRSEISGKRFWGWAKRSFGTPECFFSRFFVINYCPLFFMEESGRTRTPDQLKASERGPLLTACDRALRRSMETISPRYGVGVGKFAEERGAKALKGLNITLGGICHPSPANPLANRGWELLIEAQLRSMGIRPGGSDNGVPDPIPSLVSTGSTDGKSM